MKSDDAIQHIDAAYHAIATGENVLPTYARRKLLGTLLEAKEIALAVGAEEGAREDHRSLLAFVNKVSARVAALEDCAVPPPVPPTVADIDAARDRLHAAERAEVEYQVAVQSGEIQPDVDRRTEIEVEIMKAMAALLRARCPDRSASTADAHSDDPKTSWAEIAHDVLGPSIEVGEDARTLTVTADPRTIAVLASVVTSTIHGG